MKKEKRSKVWVPILIGVLLILSYIIYFFVVQISTRSDDLSLFPTAGVWVAAADGYSIEIDLDGESPVITLTLIETSESFELEQAISGSHGTIFYPSTARSILKYTSKDTELISENYISFSCSRFKFNENDFYMKKIYVNNYNKISLIKNNTNLHFIKQDENY